MADSRNVVKNINLKGTSVSKLDISAATKFQKFYYDKILLEHVLLYKCSLLKTQNMHSKLCSSVEKREKWSTLNPLKTHDLPMF